MELNSTAPLPDELLASYLSRLAKINGFRDQRDIWNAVNGRSDCTSFIDAEVCFPRLAEVMGGIAGAAECLVKDCTFLPTQVILGELSDDQLLNIAAAVTMPSLSDLTFVGPAALKYCEQCIQDDSANHDVSYWHRVHQIPMVNVCPIHQVLLVRVQFKRADLHYKFPLPIEVPSRLISSPAGAMCAPMLAVAEIAQRALAASDEEWKQDLRAVICEELGNRRYLRRGAGLLRKILVADLS